MTEKEFESRYRSQLRIGKIIDTCIQYELDVNIGVLDKIANSISPHPNLRNAHWHIEPIKPAQAIAIYHDESDLL